MSVTMSVTCSWYDSGEDDVDFETGCGRAFVLNEPGLAENEIKFCMFCGKLIKEVKEDDADTAS